MLIIVSPTKQMKATSSVPATSLPKLQTQAKRILKVLTSLSQQDIEKRMHVNAKIAQENVERFKAMRFDQHGTPAITTYRGLAFQHMRMDTYDEQDWEYVNTYQRILSGFYGVLHPFDSIYPYRIEMKCKLSIQDTNDMYTYWKDTLAIQLKKEIETHEERWILNLASKEYAQAILPYLDDVVTVVFYEEKKGILKTQSTQVKMARGAMVQYLVKHRITRLEGVKKFTNMGYTYEEERSSTKELVFVKKE